MTTIVDMVIAEINERTAAFAAVSLEGRVRFNQGSWQTNPLAIGFGQPDPRKRTDDGQLIWVIDTNVGLAADVLATMLNGDLDRALERAQVPGQESIVAAFMEAVEHLIVSCIEHHRAGDPAKAAWRDLHNADIALFTVAGAVTDASNNIVKTAHRDPT